MKNAYRKSLMAIVFSFFAVTGAFAQFSVGLELALPMGDFGDVYDMGFGASGAYQKAINDNLSWTGYAGFQTHSGKSSVFGSTSATYTNIPILAGVKYYFQESGNGLYGEIDLGMNFQSINIGGFGSASETKFGITPSIGYRVSSFDFAARYNAVGDFGNLAIRAAYVFGAK